MVWRDPAIWISFSQAPDFGATDPNGRDVVVTDRALAGIEMAAATVVHELAHTNGAPGGNNRLAELTLRQCGFSAMFSPAILGVRPRRPSYRMA